MAKLETIKLALDAMGVRLYEDKSCYPEGNARRNLMGRTHYVDDDIMHYFKARINSAYHSDDGLTFYIRESVGHPSDGRLHRCVLFDVFGDVLTDRSDALYKTSKQAQAHFDQWRKGFDVLAHTEARIRSINERAIRTATEALAILD